MPGINHVEPYSLHACEFYWKPLCLWGFTFAVMGSTMLKGNKNPTATPQEYLAVGGDASTDVLYYFISEHIFFKYQKVG